MKNTGLFLSLVVFLAMLNIQSGFCQTGNVFSVSKEDALKVGTNFYSNMLKSTDNPKQSLSVKESFSVKSTNGTDCIYAFNFNEGGFVLVSADSRSVPVLAYSDEDGFYYSDMAPATRLWIDKYMEQFDLIKEKDLPQSEQVQQMWYNYSKGIFTGSKETEAVSKLVLTKWNQDYPYNYFCPVHSQGPGGHVYAGCVATAMAQIMKYWNYPEHGRGTKEYFWGDYFDVDLEAATYDWDLMPNTIAFNTTQEAKEEIAEIIFHSGITVDMNYGYDGSSASISSAWWAFKQYFKYRSGVYEQSKDTTPNAEWKFKLKQDLDMSRPILYRGTDDGGNGHAFVCDGYQDTSYFHFNWGWSGYNDGYYYLDAIDPQIEFYWSQAALFNLAPNYADYCSSASYTLPQWSFGDGSGPNYYFNETDCNWIIAPDVEDFDYIKLTFSKYDLLEGDTLKIYEGFADVQTLNLIGSFSASNNPGEITTEGNKFYLEFKTNSQGQADGWEATYETVTLGVNEENAENINIFPNPAGDCFYVAGVNSAYNLEILDISGKLIYEQPATTEAKTDISFLSTGIYIIKITDNKNTYLEKLIKK